jgi:hypothetical protein
VEGDEQNYVVSCIDSVSKLTASSISLGDFRLILRFVLFSREDLKVVQSIGPWVRISLFSLFGGIVSIVRITDE